MEKGDFLIVDVDVNKVRKIPIPSRKPSIRDTTTTLLLFVEVKNEFPHFYCSPQKFVVKNA